MINQGRSNKEIGGKLKITERTVKFHVSQLLNKLQVTNRRELMLIFGRSNIGVNQLNALDSAMNASSLGDGHLRSVEVLRRSLSSLAAPKTLALVNTS